MTEQEIQDVRAAWEAAPASRVRSVLGLMEWNKTMQAWLWRPTPYSDELSLVFHPDALIRDALHRRLLELGAWVKVNDEVFRAWQGMTRPAFHLALAESPSLLSCMARAIVALSNTRSDR